MKIRVLVLLLGILSCKVLSQVAFQKTYGLTRSNGILKVIPTIDKGYAFVGTMDTASSGTSTPVFFIVKTDSLGDTLWSTTCYGLNNTNSWFDIVEAKGGGFAVVGDSRVGGLSDVFLMRISSSGTISWVKTFGGSYVDYGYALCATLDGGFALTGDCESFPPSSSKTFLVKTDSSGNLIFAKVIGDLMTLRSGNSIKQINTGGYIIAGSITGAGAGSTDCIITLVDSSGNVLWEKVYGGPQDDYIDCIQKLSNGDFLACGLTNSFGHGGFDAWALKIDSVGNTLWAKAYGTNNYESAYNFNELQNHNLIFSGHGGSNSDSFIFLTDSTGNILWCKGYGIPGNYNSITNVELTWDKGFVVGGVSSAGTNSKSYLIKTDSLGVSGCNEFPLTFGSISVNPGTSSLSIVDSIPPLSTGNVILSYSSSLLNCYSMCPANGIKEMNYQNIQMNVFPNPANSILNIETNLSDTEIRMFDILGNNVLSDFLSFKKQIDISRLAQGIYLVRLIKMGKYCTLKFVKE